MTAAHAILSGFELLLIVLIIYGYMKEDKVIAFEKKMKRNVCRFIYNKICQYEQSHNLTEGK